MNFVDLSIPFQVEVTEENPRAASNIAPEESRNEQLKQARQPIKETLEA